MWKVIRGVGLFACCLILAWLLWVVSKVVAPELSIPGVSAPSVSYAELIAILLTGLAIALGMLGIVVAVLAMWGYRAIRDESKQIAGNVARAEARNIVLEYLRSPAGAKIVESEVAKRLDDLKEGLALAQSYSQLQAKETIIQSDTGEQTERVGKPFPPRKEAK